MKSSMILVLFLGAPLVASANGLVAVSRYAEVMKDIAQTGLNGRHVLLDGSVAMRQSSAVEVVAAQGLTAPSLKLAIPSDAAVVKGFSTDGLIVGSKIKDVSQAGSLKDPRLQNITGQQGKPEDEYYRFFEWNRKAGSLEKGAVKTPAFSFAMERKPDGSIIYSVLEKTERSTRGKLSGRVGGIPANTTITNYTLTSERVSFHFVHADGKAEVLHVPFYKGHGPNVRELTAPQVHLPSASAIN